MRDPRKGPSPEDVAVAALLAQPFAVYLLVLRALAPPSDVNWAHADPILTLLPREATLWLAPALSVAAAVLWWRIACPPRVALRAGMKEGLAGALLAVLAAGLVRVAFGPTLPSFIPPEESAAPGYLLSMTAGLDEEVVCRLGIMPALCFALGDRVPGIVNLALAPLATGLVFAVWHAIGEDAFSTPYFVTRLLIPGCAMSLVWLVSPAAIVSGHCTAHLLIPALFVSTA
jgi:hypothetical protein